MLIVIDSAYCHYSEKSRIIFVIVTFSNDIMSRNCIDAFRLLISYQLGVLLPDQLIVNLSVIFSVFRTSGGGYFKSFLVDYNSICI